MDLKQRSAGDFDILPKRNDMQVAGGTDEGDELILSLCYPIIIEVLPAEGRVKAKIFYRDVHQVMEFSMPLGIVHEMEVPLEWALGILRQQEDLELEIPLARTLEQVCLLLEMPLKINPIKLQIAVSKTGKKTYGIEYKGRFGRTKKETVKTLKALTKLLKGD